MMGLHRAAAVHGTLMQIRALAGVDVNSVELPHGVGPAAFHPISAEDLRTRKFAGRVTVYHPPSAYVGALSFEHVFGYPFPFRQCEEHLRMIFDEEHVYSQHPLTTHGYSISVDEKHSTYLQHHPAISPKPRLGFQYNPLGTIMKHVNASEPVFFNFWLQTLLYFDQWYGKGTPLNPCPSQSPLVYITFTDALPSIIQRIWETLGEHNNGMRSTMLPEIDVKNIDLRNIYILCLPEIDSISTPPPGVPVDSPAAWAVFSRDCILPYFTLPQEIRDALETKFTRASQTFTIGAQLPTPEAASAAEVSTTSTLPPATTTTTSTTQMNQRPL